MKFLYEFGTTKKNLILLPTLAISKEKFGLSGLVVLNNVFFFDSSNLCTTRSTCSNAIAHFSLFLSTSISKTTLFCINYIFVFSIFSFILSVFFIFSKFLI
jgi:hypothetical protein